MVSRICDMLYVSITAVVKTSHIQAMLTVVKQQVVTAELQHVPTYLRILLTLLHEVGQLYMIMHQGLGYHTSSR